MSTISYSDFRLKIEPGSTATSYRIEASGFGGDRSASFELPFSDVELENFVLKMARPRSTVRRIDSPEMETARKFGGTLFAAIMAGGIGEAFREARGAATAQKKGLRVLLSMTDVPKLATIPWEFLFDDPDFLSTSRRTPIVRTLDVMKPARPFELAPPIRILAAVSQPKQAVELKTGQERANLEKALAPLTATGGVAVDWLDHATLSGLNDKLSVDEYHILHFIGHGGFDRQTGKGALLFEDASGGDDIVGADRIAEFVRDRESLQLVVLNSCEGARGDVDDPFSGVAASLIQREVPAVIGMQFEITDRAAIIFATKFYTFLGRGEPVDAAVAEARRAIYADRNDVEWATPVLFMRVADGRLFTIRDAVAIPDVEPDVPERKIETPPPPPPLGLGARVAAWFGRLPRRTWAVAGAAVLVAAVIIVLLLLPPPEVRAAIDVGQAEGQPGVLSVEGSGFEPGEIVALQVNNLPHVFVVTDSTGAFSTTVVAGADMAGAVSALGDRSQRKAAASFSLAVVPSESTGPTAVASETATPSASSSVEPTATPTTAPTSPPPESERCTSSSTASTLAPSGGGINSGGILFYSDYEAGSDESDYELYTVDPGSKQIDQLTADHDINNMYATWSPDHVSIAYTATVNGSGDICLVARDGTVSPLVADRRNDYYPAWSLDGSIAFVRETGSGSSIMVQRPGEKPVALYSGHIVRGPAWSPDGSTLAFFGDLNGSDYDIATIPSTGGEPRIYVEPGTNEYVPSWSPKGTEFAIVRGIVGESSTNHIYTVDVESGKLINELTSGTQRDGNPSWSPDGSQVAFYRETPTGYTIMVTDSAGNGSTEDLMSGRPGKNLDPVWR
jgi:hypothetical protein